MQSCIELRNLHLGVSLNSHICIWFDCLLYAFTLHDMLLIKCFLCRLKLLTFKIIFYHLATHFFCYYHVRNSFRCLLGVKATSVVLIKTTFLISILYEQHDILVIKVKSSIPSLSFHVYIHTYIHLHASIHMLLWNALTWKCPKSILHPLFYIFFFYFFTEHIIFN